MSDDPRSPTLTIRVVYEDLPDLIEVEARIVFGDWSAVTRAYTGPSSLAKDARGLLAWSQRPVGEFSLEAGADTGIGWAHLRWYPIDRAGHLACHVRLATQAIRDRPEVVRRLALEVPVEAFSVERFARQLLAVSETLTGEAVLSLVTA
jgi:hypothetical protein